MRDVFLLNFVTTQQHENLFFFFARFLFYFIYLGFSRCMFEKYLYVNNSSNAYLVNEYVKKKEMGKKWKTFSSLLQITRPFAYIFIHFHLSHFVFVCLFVVYRYMTVHVLHSAIRFLDWLGNIIFLFICEQ